ncbi:AI-2E family transporter [Candidatus Uhrbacteria bacterium]|nr:AI-2E family transporter [Candidatus Uhrbacteria bacterium]
MPGGILAPTNKNHVVRWFFLLVSTGLLFLFWKMLEPFAFVLITAGITAIVVSPLDDHLSHYFHHDKIRAFLLSCLVFLVLVLPLFLTAVLIIFQARDVLTLLQGADLGSLIRPEKLPFGSLVAPWLLDLLSTFQFKMVTEKIAQYAFANIGELFSSTAQLILNTFIYFLSVYYFLSARKRIKQEMLDLSPLKDSLDKAIIDRISTTIRAVVFGALIISIIRGVLAAIGMTIFGVPGAIIWGAITVVAAQVPIVGVGVVLVPATLFLFASGESAAAFGLLAWSTVIVGLADNILGPIIMKNRTNANMHSLLILLSILGGIQLFGSIGIIMGPTVLAAIMIVLELYKHGLLNKPS